VAAVAHGKLMRRSEAAAAPLRGTSSPASDLFAALPGFTNARFLFVSQYRHFSNRFRLSEIYLCSAGWINGRISQAVLFTEFRVARGPSQAGA
jgi:hypothetical protein